MHLKPAAVWRIVPVMSVLFLAGCRTALPTEVVYSTSGIADAPLRQNVELCMSHLNELRDSARKSGNFSDVMTVIGGVLGAGGSVTAATFQAIDPKNSQPQTITAAAFGAAGGLLAIISKLVDSPTSSLNLHSKGRAHWVAARKLVDPNTLMGPTDKDYAPATDGLIRCQNDSE
jgi:hypothetical protein